VAGRSHNGPMNRTVRDSALLMEALAGPDVRDPASDLQSPASYLDFAHGSIRGARVAVSHNFGYPTPLDPEVLPLLDEAAGLLRQLGCQVTAADPPSLDATDELAPGVWAYSGDHYAGAEAMIPGFWEKHADDLTDYNRPVYDAGRKALAWQYRRILRRNQAYAIQMKEWFRDFDFLISPISGPAPKIGDKREGSRDERAFGFLVAFNIAYNPAASVPLGFHSSGLPMAVQVVGKLGDDVGVLRLSAAMEAERPWTQRWPRLAEEIS
jgi:aspartyl-tRNA(Asn)/glutamyl-tRNA(Gln) amidotransferase subunit A